MDTSKNKTKMQFLPGGFSAHCLNLYVQEYDYFSNEENPLKR